MTGTLVFDPLLPLWLIATLGVLLGAGLVLALWRGLSGGRSPGRWCSPR